MNNLKDFHGVNSGYVMELYERFLENPSLVDPTTRKIFNIWKPEPGKVEHLKNDGGYVNGMTDRLDFDVDKVVAVSNLAQSIRRHGHMESKIDPLGSETPSDPTLDPQMHGITEDDLKNLPSKLVGWPIADESSNAYEAISKLKKIYSSTIGYSYDHIYEAEERKWLRESIEKGLYRPPIFPMDELKLLENLTRAEVFEHFLHRIFPGKFRFSIEGVDALVFCSVVKEVFV